MTDTADVTGFCHRVTVKEIPPAAFCDILKVLESDFKDVSHSNVSMSQDDVQFIQLLESSNTKGHIEMSLPFKVRPQLPNGRVQPDGRRNNSTCSDKRGVILH